MMSMIPHAVWNGGRVIVSSGFSMANLARLMSLSQNRFKFFVCFCNNTAVRRLTSCGGNGKNDT